MIKIIRIFLLLGIIFTFQVPIIIRTAKADSNPISEGACDPNVVGSEGGASSPVCTATESNTVTGNNGLISTIANIVAWATGVIAVFMIIFSGFRFITAGGDSAKISSARNTILYSAIGLVVIVLARIIVSFVINNLK
jgi:hypothetical protein